jgi:hypothetical protein
MMAQIVKLIKIQTQTLNEVRMIRKMLEVRMK